MTMLFRTVKDAVATTLSDNAAGNFSVVGYQRQNKSSESVKDNSRLVQVYYASGDFPKSAGRFRGNTTHDITIEIDLTASAAATGDLTVLENPLASASAKTTALAAVKEAAETADTKVDELIDLVYNILMDANNFNLGLAAGVISSRWIDGIKKDLLLDGGGLVVKTANMKYTCRVTEIVTGAIPNDPSPAEMNSTVDFGDTTDNAGTINNN